MSNTLHRNAGVIRSCMRTCKGAVVATLLATVLARTPLAAQQSDAEEHKTFYRSHDAVVAAEFLGASAALSLFDARLAHFFQDSALLHVRAGRKVDNFFTHINETTLTVGGLGVWAIARLAGAHTVADVSFHVSEAVFAASITSQLIRGPLGRTRPRDAKHPFTDQYEFHFGQGFGHFQQRAFPSIHSSSGFAAASVIVAEVRQRNPSAAWAVGVPAYAMALTPGLSRMYLGQHWASDIFAGAFMGTFYGWRVVNYSHSHPTTAVDRLFLGKRNETQAQVHALPTPYSFGWTISF